jgi:hypothetical protein
MVFNESRQDAATHYVPWFAIEARVFRGQAPRRLQAVCGETIDRTTSTNEPTCAACQAYLAADPYAGKTGADVFGTDEVAR